MNVLIVDDDKSFGKAVLRIVKKCDYVDKVAYYDDYKQSCQKLNESPSSYNMQIINLDSIKSNMFFIKEDVKYVVYSKNSKTIKKYINNPSIQRIFFKPINLTNLQNYLFKYCNLKVEQKPQESIINTLVAIGFSLNYKGTYFLAEAIKLAMQDYSKKHVTIYSEIGKSYNLSDKQILWAINNSINRLVKTNNSKKYNGFFNIYDGRKPTPKFIIDFFRILYKPI